MSNVVLDVLYCFGWLFSFSILIGGPIGYLIYRLERNTYED